MGFNFSVYSFIMCNLFLKAMYERRQTRSVTKQLDPVSTASESEDTATLVPQAQLSSESKEEWLAVINPTISCKNVYTLDNLLLYITNNLSYFHFCGNISQSEKYEEFKEQVAFYKGQNDFESKFKVLKNILASVPKILEARCRLMFLNVGKKGRLA